MINDYVIGRVSQTREDVKSDEQCEEVPPHTRGMYSKEEYELTHYG